MRERKTSVLLSAKNVDLTTVIPTQVLLTSDRLAWKGLFARVFRHQPNTQLNAPVVIEDLIHLGLQGTTCVEGKVVRRFHGERAGPSDIFIIPKEERNEWEWTTGMEMLQLCLSPTLLATIAAEALDVEPNRIEFTERIAIRDPLIYHIGLALLSELQSEGLIGRLYGESLIHTFAMHLLRNHAVFPQHPPKVKAGLPTTSLQLVLDYINAYLAQDLALAELAALAHTSPYHFTRLFKQSMGRSLHQYVIERRIEEAKRLLVAGHLNIAQVAVLVGFHDQSHFYRHFKRLTGITPRRLIEQRKNIQ